MSRHLGEQLTDYVDRRLPASALLAWDRHLVACAQCRYAADEERRVLASLRSAPDGWVPPSLHSLLLQVAASQSSSGLGRPEADRHGSPGGLAAVPVPRAPFPVQPMRLPTVPPSTPALHRSTRKAAALVGFAASLSAAAAWSLTVGPVAPTQANLTPPSGAATGRAATVMLVGGSATPRAGTSFVARVASLAGDDLRGR